MSSFALTDIGVRRKLNEDYVFACDGKVGNLPNLYIVADGMGGHKAGDYASRFTVEHLVEEIRACGEKKPRDIMESVLLSVNRELFDVAESDAERHGMGTTLVMATIVGNTLLVANVGDSRLYILEERLRQVTIDHSLVEEMILSGDLDEKKARNHPDKNVITRAVGVDRALVVDFFLEDLSRTKAILMCTDGLTNMIEDEEIERILQLDLDAQLKAELLIEDANRFGGKDNISVLLIDPGSEEEDD
ncbi:MAG: Stp1/IreP family PP2C-type Ser/Thr phosphatase [Lachnospiraceae bacterium]|nr:Stp1/IreP family PP2C-type Ser/Thr phosphatase [Lachnospiraceae bacterium]